MTHIHLSPEHPRASVGELNSPVRFPIAPRLDGEWLRTPTNPVLSLLRELSAVGIVAKIQSKPFSHPIERASINTENLCRFHFIPLGFLQHPDEMTLLDFLKRQTPLIAVADRPGLLQR